MLEKFSKCLIKMNGEYYCFANFNNLISEATLTNNSVFIRNILKIFVNVIERKKL